MKIIAGAALLLSLTAIVVAIIRPAGQIPNAQPYSVNKPILEQPSLQPEPFQLPTFVRPKSNGPDVST